MTDSRAAQLRAELEALFKLTELEVPLPWSGAVYRIALPAAFDPLLDAAEHDPEEQVPYWAALWPSGIALADLIAAHPEYFGKGPALELGCGLGVTAAAALAMDMDLLVTDYAPETLLLCRLNSSVNADKEPHALQLNWRKPGQELWDLRHVPAPVVLAADVLYEKRDVEPLLGLVDRLVAPGGTLWLAEPGRATARQFLQAAEARGWSDEAMVHPGPWPDPVDANVTVQIHRLRRTDASAAPTGP